MSKNKFRFIYLAAFVYACLLVCSPHARAQAMQSPIPMPDPPAPVVDYADVINAATEERLNNLLKNLSEDKKANSEFGVVTVRTTGGQDIFDYSLAIMRGWGIGSAEKEKGGLLLVVAVDDRKYFTQISRHLEGDLPDGLVGQIQRERLVPRLKQQQYSEGIFETVQAYVATLAEKRGFSVAGIDRSYAYREPKPRDSGRRSSPIFSRGSLTIFIIIIVIFFLLSSRGGGGSGCGCLNLLLLNSLLGSGGRGGWGSSGWGGGGFGGSSGWGGGGGGGWGGFSGGGGDAGGGGAGGSW